MTSMSLETPSPWDEAIRLHDRRVVLSLLALGLSSDRARELAQAAWTRLIEQHARGGLAEIELPVSRSGRRASSR